MFKLGDAVLWTSSNTRKEGIIVGIIPAGKRPEECGFPRIGDALMRDHRSYIVKGGQPGRVEKTTYWPRVNLLTHAKGLTLAEIAWCNHNIEAVRALIPAGALESLP